MNHLRSENGRRRRQDHHYHRETFVKRLPKSTGLPRQCPAALAVLGCALPGSLTSQTPCVCLASACGSNMRPSLPSGSLSFAGGTAHVSHQAGWMVINAASELLIKWQTPSTNSGSQCPSQQDDHPDPTQFPDVFLVSNNADLPDLGRSVALTWLEIRFGSW